MTDVLIQAGAVGVVVLLYHLGWLVPKPSMDRADREIAYLRQALEDERAARAAERETYRLESAPATAAAIEAAKTTAHLLTDLRKRNQPEARR
ncbi:hypothetical protein AB0C10_21335 [Microbispora amethystogenes]|uniref:hypothetical protein n=1 Tax=Microbispora amethystogenes TaxID=1427754 RepID=UPI0033D0627F